MSGRFFVAPFLLAVMLLVRHLADGRVWRPALLVGAVVLGIVIGPRPPLLSNDHYVALPIDPTGIRDERGGYHEDSSLLKVYDRKTPGNAQSLAGRRFRVLEPKVLIWGAIGYEGFVSGPNVQTIDPIGLPDPLLARLPGIDVDGGWGRGHIFRKLPAGYIASLELGENLIADPALHAYYDHLRTITRGPIFTLARFREIWRMNTGGYQPLLDAYVKGAPPPSSLAAPDLVRASAGSDALLSGLPGAEHAVLAPLVAEGLTLLDDVRDFFVPNDLDYALGAPLDGEPFLVTTRLERHPSLEDPTVPFVKRAKAPSDAAVVMNGHVVALRWRHATWSNPSALAALTELRLLDLYDGQLRSLDGIDALGRLVYLDVSRNALTSLAPVAALQRLRVLHAAQAGLTRIDGVRDLGALREVNLALNGIEHIDGLDGTIGEHLTYLSLEGNPITKIEGLDHLHELRFLNLSFAKLSVIENLGALKELVHLDLWANGIRTIKGLEEVPSVYYVALGDNPSDWGDAANVAEWDRLGRWKYFFW